VSDRSVDLTVRELRAEAAKQAEEVLDEYWHEGTYPIDPVRIAIRMGVEVFEAQLGNDVFGMLVGAGADGGAQMYIDKDQPKKRYRFTCAHELGHYVDHSGDPSGAYIDRRTDEDRGTRDEIYANEFAGNLLMPARELERHMDTGKTRFAMADHFDVSPAALDYRIKVLGSRLRA
jgi:Zn-dependent peptidase ImmA (M78 family)